MARKLEAGLVTARAGHMCNHCIVHLVGSCQPVFCVCECCWLAIALIKLLEHCMPMKHWLHRCCHAQFGNGTLRLTTRQTYQLHGVLKQDLKSVFSSVIKNMGSTLGACGDVNRNVLAPPVRLPFIFK